MQATNNAVNAVKEVPEVTEATETREPLPISELLYLDRCMRRNLGIAKLYEVKDLNPIDIYSMDGLAVRGGMDVRGSTHIISKLDDLSLREIVFNNAEELIGLDLSNVMIAGAYISSIFNSLICVEGQESSADSGTKAKLLFDAEREDTDVDLFIYGLSEKEATKKVEYLVAEIATEYRSAPPGTKRFTGRIFSQRGRPL